MFTRRALVLLAFLPFRIPAQSNRDDPSAWTIFITNDACSDYTWGFDEPTTRQAYADLVNAHLDEMTRTDHETAYNQDRYNASITHELDAFLERYPQRREELYRRIHEGRLSVGPVYNNALWGFQSTEGMLRAMYPARRLEKAAGVRIRVAEHIEQPSLPWGAASLLKACGMESLSVPYYDFDSNFSKLTNPPLFMWEGPDGAQVLVVMDRFASGKQGYWQGKYLLEKPERILSEWLPAYQHSDGYPAFAILASGTHFDNGPANYKLARGYNDTIIRYNAQMGPHPRLVNGTLPMFFDAISAAHPNLPVLRGSFGDSWDAWPVSLAKYASAARVGERDLLTAESLLAAAGAPDAGINRSRGAWRKAEWNWAMLADHAWNGSDDANRLVNAALRRRWSAELTRLAGELDRSAWQTAGLIPDDAHVAVFNGLSFARSGTVRIEVPGSANSVTWQEKPLKSQAVDENGRRVLYFDSPVIPAYGFAVVSLRSDNPPQTGLRATATEAENAWYRLRIDPQHGGLASILVKKNGRELLAPGAAHAIGETVYFDGAEHRLENVTSELLAIGPVLARIRIHGTAPGMDVVSYITIYSAHDDIDFDIRVHKAAGTHQERVTQVFPVADPHAGLRLETMGAVIRPTPSPEGDLLPGADPNRFAVQHFADVMAPESAGVTVAPVEAFLLRKDLEGISFEALGDDQNFKEVSHDQGGETDFRFRYSLRGYTGGYNNAVTAAWSRSATMPLEAVHGRIGYATRRGPALDPARAIALAYKPAEEGGRLLRIWETGGRSGPIAIAVPGFGHAVLTDLLERPLKPVPVTGGHISLELTAHGYAAVRLIP